MGPWRRQTSQIWQETQEFKFLLPEYLRDEHSYEIIG